MSSDPMSNWRSWNGAGACGTAPGTACFGRAGARSSYFGRGRFFFPRTLSAETRGKFVGGCLGGGRLFKCVF